MKEPTILHSFPIWLPQTQTWMYSQVADLQQKGMDVHVVCERTENLKQFNVSNIHALADQGIVKEMWDRTLRKLGFREHLNYLIEVGRDVRAEIVHSHFGDIAWRNLGAARRLDIKHVVTFYGYDVNKLPMMPIWRERYQRLFAEGDLFLCEGGHMAQCLVELGCPENKVAVQHLGVDVAGFEFKPRQWWKGTPLRILIAASFREKKGIPYAIDALGAISKEWPIEVTIMGDSGPDTASREEKERILSALERNGLRQRTRLLGYQPHNVMLREAYDHHIFLQPSVTASDGDTEGGAPVSIIELMATGMVVVSTQHCDIPEVMGPGLDHLRAPERDPGALAAILRDVIHRTDQWSEWAATGRARAIAEYNRSVQADKLIAHYTQLLDFSRAEAK